MGHFDWPIAKNILKLCPLPPPKIKVTYFYTIFYCRVKPVSGMRTTSISAGAKPRLHNSDGRQRFEQKRRKDIPDGNTEALRFEQKRRKDIPDGNTEALRFEQKRRKDIPDGKHRSVDFSGRKQMHLRH